MTGLNSDSNTLKHLIMKGLMVFTEKFQTKDTEYHFPISPPLRLMSVLKKENFISSRSGTKILPRV